MRVEQTHRKVEHFTILRGEREKQLFQLDAVYNLFDQDPTVMHNCIIKRDDTILDPRGITEH